MKIFAATAAAFMLLIAGSTHAQNVSVRNLMPPGAFEVVSEGGEVSLSSRVQVQRFYNGAWQDEGTDMQFVCSYIPSELPACITLRDGEHLRPPPWNGLSCGSQSKCGAVCRGNAMSLPGTFRFVVTLCSGGKSFAGPAFYMEEGPRKPARPAGSTRRKNNQR